MESEFNYLQEFFRSYPTEGSALIDQAILETYIENSMAIEGGSSFFWLINYLKREPEYVSEMVKQVLGYHKAFLKNDKMTGFLRLIPAEDRKMLRKVFLDIYKFYQVIPLNEKHLYRFDFNFRVQRADQRLISVMQQVMFLQSSSTGMPLIELSLLTDFSTYKNNNQIQLQIFKMENEVYQPVGSWQYDEFLDSLTERENEIICLIANGFTDKEIADKACISLHTVKTHRKNIVSKTKSRNTAEAVSKYITIRSPQL